MPAFLTHEIIAEEVYKQLPLEIKSQIKDFSCFLLGAQGGDPFFLYSPLSKRKNLGKLMHRKNVYPFFFNLAFFLKNDKFSPSVFSFVLGYITHYAVDCTFHPFVYDLERQIITSQEKKRKHDKFHFLIERDIDKLLFVKFNKSFLGSTLFVSIDDVDLKNLFNAFKVVIFDTYDVKINYFQFKNAVKSFLFWQKKFLNEKSGKTFYRLETALHLPHLFSYLFIENSKNGSVLDKDLTDKVLRLTSDSVLLATRLIEEFLLTFNGKKLNEEMFGNDFNLGKEY